MNWYYDLGGQRQGPVSEAELDRLLAAGTILPATLVWREGMPDWTPLNRARPAGEAAAGGVPEGWIRCSATGRHFPPSQIVWLDGKPYSAEAKPGIVQGVLQGGALPDAFDENRTGPAWEQRAQVGFFRAIWETCKGVLLQPSLTFANMKREGGIGTPLGYHVLVGSAGGALSTIYNFVFKIDATAFLPPEMRQQQFALHLERQPAFVIGMLIAMPLLIIIGTFIMSGVWHLSLMICGGARQPFETTLRTVCYAMGSGTILAFFPICGGTVGFIWALVSLCIGLAKTHDTATGRAVGAVLLPVGTCCLLYVLLIVAAVGLAVGATGAHH